MIILLRYISFVSTFEMSLSNCVVNLILNWYKQYVKYSKFLEVQVTTYTITDTKLYVAFLYVAAQRNENYLKC